MNEEHVIDAIPAYALGCLDREEASQVEQHLVSCAECRSEYEHYQQVVACLPYAAPEMAPPGAVKDRLMRQVGRQLQVETRQEGSPSLWDRLAAAFRQTPSLAFVSMVVILLLAASNLLLWQQVNVLRDTRSSQLQTIQLNGTDTAPQATGLIVVSMDGEHGTLVVDHLPGLDESRQYQLWLIEDGQRTSGGVFSVSQDGYGSLWVEAPLPLVDYSAFGITVEPAGGSPGPTGDRVLGSSL